MCELFVVPFVKHGDVIYKVKYLFALLRWNFSVKNI